MTVLSNTIRQDVYSAIRTLLVANKPTYTDPDGETQTYTITAEFQAENPILPQIAINSALISPILITLDGETNEQGIGVQLDLYVRDKHGYKGIDAGMDSIQNTILTNQTRLKGDDKLVLMTEAFDESNPAEFTSFNQQIKTKSIIIKMKLA